MSESSAMHVETGGGTATDNDSSTNDEGEDISDDGLDADVALLPDPRATLEDESKEETLDFEDLYETDSLLRRGSYGEVFVCHHKKRPSEHFAVKIMDRSKLKKKDDNAVLREVNVMKELIHNPYVVQLIDFFRTPERLYMVQILAEGGDVFDRLSERKHYTENSARDLALVLLKAIDSMHSIKPYPIIHRDLKPENLLLKARGDDTDILLADFGFARHVKEDQCRTRCGTPAFVAPEIVIGAQYSLSADLWSTGCLIYMLIGGYPPFHGATHKELFYKIRAGDFVFHESHFGTISVAAKTMLSRLLTVRVDLRMTAREALQCDWITKESKESLAANHLHGTIEEFKKFKAHRKWKAAKAVVSWASSRSFWKSDNVTFHQATTTRTPKPLPAATSSDDVTERPGHHHHLIHKANGPDIDVLVTDVKFTDVYELKGQIRKGSHATVWACVHKKTQERFAVKIIRRENLRSIDDEHVLSEVAIMQSLSGNKYTLQLLDFMEEPEAFYLVMDYMGGGDVFDRIVRLTHYSEREARDLTEILLKAVASMHKMGIAHRDIKPQNLLLASERDNFSIRVADFGFSRRVHAPNTLTSRVGTPTYVAPEILKNIPHDERVDLWSVGVVVFVLLVGYPPFLEEKQSDLFDTIRAGEWSFVERDWAHISMDAKDLIKGLLKADPYERWTTKQALRCRWINKDAMTLSSISLMDSITQIRRRRGRLRNLARVVMWLGHDDRLTDVRTQADPHGHEHGSENMETEQQKTTTSS